MKTIVIAYDGSEGADAVFSEIQRAGLPSQLTAHVVSVAEQWRVPESAAASWAATPAMLPPVADSQVEEAGTMRRASLLAEKGAERVRSLFPAWTVAAEGWVGSVGRTIVQRAGEVSAELIFIGSHSRSAVGRFFLGSVSQKVAADANCSVRICRPGSPSGAAPRLLVAVDGSQQSRVAVRAAAKRSWPAGTAVAVVNVVEPALRSVPGLSPEDAAEIQRQHSSRLGWLGSVNSAAQRQFESAGLAAECHSLDGEPKSALLEWAERWNADCLFIGASGLHHPSTDTLGTVASALAVRAHCSVEIVR